LVERFIIGFRLMKIQDLVFLFVFLLQLGVRSPKLAAGLGLLCLILAIPLFEFWVFFTAERLTWYAATFFLSSVLLYWYKFKFK